MTGEEEVGFDLFTLTFDSSPIKGEGEDAGASSGGYTPSPTPLWIADQVRNDVTMRCIVFTLTFDSSPIKGEGILSVGVVNYVWLWPSHGFAVPFR